MPGQEISNERTFKILSKMEPKTIPFGRSKSFDEDSIIDTMIVPSGSHSSGIQNSASINTNVISSRQWITVIVLCFVNLINYMDRYTIAGVLAEIQSDFSIGDDKGGLLQTAFVVSYMLFAPIFGYLGDRYNRRFIMAAGILIWSATTLAGSFMKSYYGLIIFRAMVGLGEASYSTIAPTLISDLFTGRTRSNMLALFYFAIPVGSGLGYIVGSVMSKLLGTWHWALRLTPALGLLAVILVIVVVEEPARGHSEGIETALITGSWWRDIKSLLKNRSFILSTAGFTCVSFVAGALAWWGPVFISYGAQLVPSYESLKLDQISVIFGVLAMISGIMGVPLGAYLSSKLKGSFERADPLICAVGLLVSTPIVFISMLLAGVNVVLCYMFIFFGELFLNLNWSIVADILLYVVPPARRSTAEAFQILISHLFGDAGSPYFVGMLSEYFKSNNDVAPDGTVPPIVLYHSLQYALFSVCFVEVIGAFFFFIAALYVVLDKAEAERELEGEDNPVAATAAYSDDPETIA